MIGQIDRGVYANFHNHSRGTLKRHLFTAETPKKLFRDLNAVTGDFKKGDPEKERMFDRSAKIPIANALSELAEMDFAGYGDFATALRIQDAFPCFPPIVYIRGRRGKQNKHREL